MQNFTVTCYQNVYLPQDGREISAIITVSAERPTGTPANQTAHGGAEVIVLDVSGSMAGEKLAEARAATEAAIGCMRDGVRFAIVAGNEKATQVFPTSGMVPATARTRLQASSAVARLEAEGGTAIGAWISLTGRLLSSTDGFRHAILLTDGVDEHETPEALDAALVAARGLFQCDCRGIGTDWSVAELRKVADALLGSVDIVADPAALVPDFTDMMQSVMRRAYSDVRIRVCPSSRCDLVFAKQVSPELRDLVPARASVGQNSYEYPVGAWGNESRDFHLAVSVPNHDVGEELTVARVSVIADGVEAATCGIRAVWTDDETLSTRINRQVAHFTGQEAIAAAIQEGLDARRRGDDDSATTKLGLAARLAAESNHTDTVALLERVVDVDDWQTGRVRLKPRVALVDEMTLDVHSTRTTRVRS